MLCQGSASGKWIISKKIGEKSSKYNLEINWECPKQHMANDGFQLPAYWTEKMVGFSVQEKIKKFWWCNSIYFIARVIPLCLYKEYLTHKPLRPTSQAQNPNNQTLYPKKTYHNTPNLKPQPQQMRKKDYKGKECPREKIERHNNIKWLMINIIILSAPLQYLLASNRFSDQNRT